MGVHQLPDGRCGMKRFLFVVLFFVLMTLPAFGEKNGWIASPNCFVTREPSGSSVVVGFIVYRAAVTVEDAGNGWLRIVFAPVRDHQMNFMDCKGCYIRADDFSLSLPPKR